MAKARAKKCEILVLNNIAQVGLKRFPAEQYAVVKEAKDPQAILVRSADLHQHEFGPSLKAVGRAGAGVNNIPVSTLSKRGVPVFNAPGANANAVKELVLAGMLLAARNLPPALDFVRGLRTSSEFEEQVDDGVVKGLNSHRLKWYVTDFPSAELLGHAGVIALPHLGASTREAEDNSAIMVVDQLRDYLELGNLQNAVNFPDAAMAREAPYRLAIAHANVPDMLGAISHVLGRGRINIHNMLNKSKGEMAYTLVDVDSPVPAAMVDEVCKLKGVLAVRYLPADV